MVAGERRRPAASSPDKTVTRTSSEWTAGTRAAVSGRPSLGYRSAERTERLGGRELTGRDDRASFRARAGGTFPIRARFHGGSATRLKWRWQPPGSEHAAVRGALRVRRSLRVHARIVGLVQRRDRVGVETAAIAALVDLDGKQVLDVGCGGGRLTGFAAVRAAYVYAFDPEAENVAKASAALAAQSRERVRFAVHDAEALDVERRRFDVALCGWSL